MHPSLYYSHVFIIYKKTFAFPMPWIGVRGAVWFLIIQKLHFGYVERKGGVEIRGLKKGYGDAYSNTSRTMLDKADDHDTYHSGKSFICMLFFSRRRGLDLFDFTEWIFNAATYRANDCFSLLSI